jgi:uncharacterized protein (TIGR00251 family)
LLLPGDTFLSPDPGSTMEPFAEAVAGDEKGVVLSLEVSPASGKAGFFTGYDPWRKSIRCAVRSPPSRGKANREVIGEVAEALGVPAASVRILSGAAHPRKQVRVEGIAREAVLERLGSFLKGE